MVEDFITIADGTTHVVFNGIDAGTVSNVVYRNTRRRVARVPGHGVAGRAIGCSIG